MIWTYELPEMLPPKTTAVFKGVAGFTAPILLAAKLSCSKCYKNNQKNCCHINSSHLHGSASKSHRWHIRDRRIRSRRSWFVAMVAPLLLTMLVVNNKTGTARTFGGDSSKIGFSSMWFDERSWVQRIANNFKIDCDLYNLIEREYQY